VGETAFHKWFSRLVVLGEMVVGRPSAHWTPVNFAVVLETT